jgi:hypothetical protein
MSMVEKKSRISKSQVNSAGAAAILLLNESVASMWKKAHYIHKDWLTKRLHLVSCVTS